MTSKKNKKGKTIALADFLSTEPKLVTVRANWSEIVDSEEAETKPIVVNIGILPTAPRGAVDIDYTTVPNNPPFVAHIANLSFEIDDEGLRRIFADLNPKTARVIRDGLRSRGIGLVEFETRENLIEGLKKTDKEVYGRKIRVNISDKTDFHQSDSGRGTFGSRPARGGSGGGAGGGEERAEMAGRWKRAEPRPDEPSDDRSSSGFNRDRQTRGEAGRSNMGGGGSREGNDYGFGYPRTRDDRGGGGNSGNRDHNRPGQRNRYPDDDNRPSGGGDRPRYGGRFSDTRDTRDPNKSSDDTPSDDHREAPKERPRLQLQPRTKPLEELQPLSGSSSSVNNVAANAEQSSILNADDSSSSIANVSIQRTQDSSINESRDEYQQQESQDSNENTSRLDISDEQLVTKPSRGAGASIFGGAKPVDTAARELEIEKKLKELGIVSTEPPGDDEEKGSSSKPSTNSNENTSRLDISDEQLVTKPSRGAGASIFGGAKPVDTAARELEIEKKLKELEIVSTEPPGDDEEKGSSSKPSTNREGGELYRAKRTSNNDDHPNRDRNRRDDGRSGHGGDYHHKREYSGGRQYEDDNRRRSDDDHYRRVGNDRDRDRYSGPPRRDQESGRTGKYNHHNQPERNNDRSSYRPRDQDTNEPNNQARPSNNNSNSEPQSRTQPRGMVRRTIPAEDDSNKLQLSNKFVMLDNDDLEENNDAQSPTTDD